MNKLLNCFCFALCLLFFLHVTRADNIATDAVSYLQGPNKGSFFGYSIIPQRSGQHMILWVGAPKFSAPNDAPSKAKRGGIFSCETGNMTSSGHEATLNLNNTRCILTELKVHAAAGKQNESSSDENLPPMALESCDLEKQGLCGFSISPKSDFNWTKTSRSGAMICMAGKRQVQQKLCKKNPTNNIFRRVRMTGPASYTVNDLYLNADSGGFPRRARGGTSRTTILISPSIRTKVGLAQCLRFCFNAYARNARWKRNLKVVLEYDAPASGQRILYQFDGQRDVASEYWNHTEVNITSKVDAFYKIRFEATVYKYKKMQYGMGDIVLTDINVANLACGEESHSGEELAGEQSIGLTLEASTGDDGVMSIAACGPLWQHDCGYAKEANGACYEMKTNNSRIIELKRHNPISQACIRGKIDIVLVVDQSGSVNQCNFQKVKRWLRDIVRGFNLGKTEQDVGVVVYSSEAFTRTVIDLGFEKHKGEGKQKFLDMMDTLKKLPFESGQTYTGSALRIANNMLFGNKSRSDANKMIILLTDGGTTGANKVMLQDQTARSRANNVSILAVGVGKYDAAELTYIAGSEKNFFAVKKFSELEKVRNKLRGSVSQGNLEGSGSANSSSENLQQCQLGFSIHYSNESLMMGAPGCYDQYGNVITHDASETPDQAFAVSGSGGYLLFHHSGSGHDEHGGMNELERNLTEQALNTTTDQDTEDVLAKEKENHKFGKYDVPTVYQIHHALLDDFKQGYFGYALSTGKYFGSDDVLYNAVSAPRFNGSGAVLLYYSITHTFSGKHQLLLPGRQFGEYFGATLCTEDFNADGFDDLLVGAPLHSSSKEADQGRVYVYMGGTNMSETPSVTLFGSGTAFSRFGSVLSPIGDINLDGYRDLAVTSLSEDEHGVVYIYHGHDDGLEKTPAQRIHPRSLKPQPSQALRNFGQSVSGSFDVDQNGYPDLMIGSPGSDTVAILLSRPVIYVNVTSVTSEHFVAGLQSCEGSQCFTWTVCLSYRGVSVPAAIVMKYALTIDAARSEPRVFFDTTQTSKLAASEEIHRFGEDHCTDHLVKVKANIRDTMSPILLHLSYEMGDFDDVKRYSGDDFAISDAFPTRAATTLSRNQSTVMHHITRPDNQTKKEFHSDHQSPLSAVVNMHDDREIKEFIPFRTFCKNATMCKTDLRIEAAILDKTGNVIKEIVTEMLTTIRIQVRIINAGSEDGHGVKLNLTYSKQLVFSTVKSDGSLSFAVWINDETCGTLGAGTKDPHKKEKEKRSAKFNRSKREALVGGKDTTIELHPWQVSLWTNKHTCGGSIIASNWILFAAHCAEPYPNVTQWTVYVGVADSRYMTSFAQSAKGTDLIAHSRFSTENYHSDIALLRLNKRLSFNIRVRSICLPSIRRYFPNGTLCRISGWSAEKEGDNLPYILQENWVKILDRAVCNDGKLLAGMVTDRMICAETVDGSRDACQDLPSCLEQDEISAETSNNDLAKLKFILRTPSLMRGSSCDVEFLFSPTRLDPHVDGKLNFSLSLTSLSEDIDLSNNKQLLSAPVSYRAHMSVEGQSSRSGIIVETNTSLLPKNFGNIRTFSQPIIHQYTIRNLGNLPLDRMVSDIYWPAHIDVKGQRFDALYLAAFTWSASNARFTCNSSNLVDPYQIYSNSSDYIAKDALRMRMKVPPQDITTTRWTCTKETCQKIACHVTDLRPNGWVRISVRSIAYPFTMARLVNRLTVTPLLTTGLGRASFVDLQYAGDQKNVQIETEIIPSFEVGTTKSAKPLIFPFWAYIASAAIGLIMLLIILLILKKMGFFKSKYGDKKRAAEEEQEWGEAMKPLKA